MTDNEDKFQVFRFTGFRRLVFAALVSGFGDALIPIAFALKATQVDPSGFGLTVVLISLWAGRFLGVAIVQRSNPTRAPTRVMIISDIVRFIAQTTLLAWLLVDTVAATGPMPTIVAMATSASVYGTAAAFFEPARFTAIPRILPQEHHSQANSWLSIVADSFSVVGPLVGSTVVLVIGFEAVLAIDAVSFLIGIAWLMGASSYVSKRADEEPSSEKAMLARARRVTLPRWVNMGFITWLIVALSIGMLGTAGPTLVIGNNSATAWAVTAAGMAIGSLVGSASTLLGFLQRFSWKTIHLWCCVGISIQLICFLLIPVPVIVCVAGFIGSALITVSGIRWDTLGQSIGSEAEIYAFATRDQTVNTVGIPTGMIVFGASSMLGANGSTVIFLAVLIFVMGLIVQAPYDRVSEGEPVAEGR